MKITKKHFDVIIEKITKSKAEKYLATSDGNRDVLARYIRVFKEDMINGRWRCSPESPISFDINGRLIDGHHRMTAVIAAAKEQKQKGKIGDENDFYVEMGVIRGIDPDDKFIIDSGKMRSAGDLFVINKVPQGKTISAIVKIYWHLKANNKVMKSFQDTKNIGKTNKDCYYEYVQDKPTFRDAAALAWPLSIKKNFNMLTATLGGGIYAHIVKNCNHGDKEGTREKATTFFKALAQSDQESEIIKNLSEQNKKIIATLRGILMESNRRGSKQVLDRAQKVATVANAWRKYNGDNKININKLTAKEGDRYDFG